MVEAVENNVCNVTGASIVHVIGEVVQMKQICQEVVAQAKLRICSVRVAHGCQKTSLKSMVRVAFVSVETIATKEPSFGLCSGLLAMTIYSWDERAVRNEVGNDDRG